MSKIKVGQIYLKKETKEKFVISSYRFVEFYCLIYQDGFVSADVNITFIENYCKLLAEYPTWQEAVNSKEFKDVAED